MHHFPPLPVPPDQWQLQLEPPANPTQCIITAKKQMLHYTKPIEPMLTVGSVMLFLTLCQHTKLLHSLWIVIPPIMYFSTMLPTTCGYRSVASTHKNKAATWKQASLFAFSTQGQHKERFSILKDSSEVMKNSWAAFHTWNSCFYLRSNHASFRDCRRTQIHELRCHETRCTTAYLKIASSTCEVTSSASSLNWYYTLRSLCVYVCVL